MKVYVIAIDGNCGSGKSTLSALLQRNLDCNVVHMDDFYLPFSKRSADWEQIPGGNMDIRRFKDTVLLPAIEGKEIVYQRYFCRENRLFDPVILPPKKILVVEGSYSHHPDLTAYYDRKLFLSCSKEEQKKRLLLREGDRYVFYEQRWIPMEERYHRAFSVPENADLIVETAHYQVYNDLLEEISGQI